MNDNAEFECMVLMVLVLVTGLLLGLAVNGYIERTTGGYISIGLLIVAIAGIMFPPKKRNSFHRKHK